MKNRLLVLTCVVVLIGSVLAGCGGNEEKSTSTAEPSAKVADNFTKDPVKITFYSYAAAINTEADLANLLGNPVKAKYPNIEIEQIKPANLAELVASGQIPDLIATTHVYMPDVLDVGLGGDLRDAIKGRNIDLGRMDPDIVNAMKMYGKNGEVFGIPYAMNYGTMVINKDIFDKFGVPYPTDNMTWDQYIDIAKKLTRSDNGVQYIGLDIGAPKTITRAMSLSVLDDKLQKAALTTPGYVKAFSLFKQSYDIPGYVDDKKKYVYGLDYMLKEQKLAMIPFWIQGLTSRVLALKEAGSSLNWDIRAFPSMADRPGVGREAEYQAFLVPPNAKNKEAAYRVIETIIANETQESLNKKGTILTVLNNPEMRTHFAEDTKVYEGKDLAGIFKVKPAPVPPSTEFDSKVYSILGNAQKSMVVEGADINTVLRQANEEADKVIAEAKK